MILFFPGNILAEKGKEIKLSVSPELFEKQVKRGDKLYEKIKIYNQSEVPVPVEAKITNFGAQEESGTITFGEVKNDISYDPKQWIKIDNPNFILDPGEIEAVNFQVQIPQNAEPGGHYAVVLFEPKLPSFYFEEGQPKAIPIIGVLFLFSVETEGLSRQGEPLTVIDFSIPGKLRLKKLENLFGLLSEARAAEKKTIITETGYLPFSLKIRNNDIYHIRPSGTLSILNTRGELIGESEIKETTILPGKTRAFPVDFKPDLPEIIKKYLPSKISDSASKSLLFGKFKAQLALKFEDKTVNQEFYFWIFPWKIILSTGAILLIFLIVMVKYRKRISGAFLVLFKK